MMKKTILLAMLAIAAFIPSFAQEADKQESKSNTILFQERGNSLMERKYFDIGTIPGVEFQNIVISNVQSGEKVGALRLITSDYSSVLKRSETFIGTIDSDELESCIKALEFMNNIVNTQDITEVDTEYEFRSRDNVRICIFTSRKKSWEMVIQPVQYSNRSSLYLKADKMPEIIELTKKAKAQLDEALGGQQ